MATYLVAREPGYEGARWGVAYGEGKSDTPGPPHYRPNALVRLPMTQQSSKL